jgi:hypothetical protein
LILTIGDDALAHSKAFAADPSHVALSIRDGKLDLIELTGRAADGAPARPTLSQPRAAASSNQR